MTGNGSRQQPLDRALAVIEQVLEIRGPVSLSEIAGSAGLPVATVHRVVAQLEARALLKRALGSKKILPGPRLVALGARILEAAAIGDRCHAVLAALAKRTGEHCHLGVISERDVLYIDSARSSEAARLHFEPGRRAPVYCTSTGKVFLASLPSGPLAEFVDGIRFEPFTPHTICDRAGLLGEIERVRQRGWASSNEEFTLGVVGCAVPIEAPSGRFMAGLGISVPAARCPFVQIDRFIPALNACAREIGAVLFPPAGSGAPGGTG